MADYPPATPLVDIEHRICPGCKQSAVNESGGLVVAFGQSFFHVDCFKCAKCNNQVTADTNLLLLSDGSPICADCSYNCNICQQPILDEAIMTGDDSYHAHCFKCKVCHNRIDELVFAKTSHGIYCMNCHNERMAKIRRHAQRKREKERAAASSTNRDREPAETSTSDRSQNFSPPSSLRSKTSGHALRDAPSTQSLQVTLREVRHSPARNGRSTSPIDPASANQSAVTTPTERQRDSQLQSTSLQPSEQSQSFVMTVAPPDTNHGPPELSTAPNGNPRPPSSRDQQDASSARQLQSTAPHLNGTSSHLSPSSAVHSTTLAQRRKSYDDGVRPLNVLLSGGVANQDKKEPLTGGLGAPSQTSRADKRRSINPGLTPQFKDTLPSSAPPEMVRSQTLPVRSDSPVAPSPAKAYFDDSIVRPSSATSVLRDNASGSTIYHSPSSSPAIPDNARATPEPPRTRSASHDPQSTVTPRPTTPLRSAPRPIVTLERPPQRSHSLRRLNGADSTHRHNTNGLQGPTAPLRLDPSKSERSSPLGWNGDRTGVMRPTSPSHRVDVPHGVESGTDTEPESSNGRKSDDVASASGSPPRPPPKPRPEPLKLSTDPDVSAVSQLEGSGESSPVERTSIATFIAPALPPIRFSMSGADFSDFLKSVGGIPSLRSLDEIAQQEAPPKSPTSVNTLIPLDDVGKPTEVASDLPGNSATAGPSLSTDDTEAGDTVPSMTHQFPSRGHTSSESQGPPSRAARERLDSDASLDIIPLACPTQPSSTRATVTSPASDSVLPPFTDETHDLVIRRLQEALSDANARGSQQLRFEKVFIETILMSLEQRHEEYLGLKEKYDRTKRASERYIDGLTVAQKEYDRELVARRNAESEIIRLRVLLSGQAAKLTALTGENSRREARRQLSEELSKDLDRLERDLSKLKAERDVTLAEVEELCTSKSAPGNVSSGEVSAAQLSRSLTMRLDNIKKQYQHELIPLTQQRETLIREIAELKSAREQFLEETTVLNVRNEELAQLSAQYTRRMEVARPVAPVVADVASVKLEPMLREKKSTSFDRPRPTQELLLPIQPSLSTGSHPSTFIDDRDIKVIRVPKPDFTDAMSSSKHGIFKWPGYRVRDQTLASSGPKGKSNFEHNFQPASALRFTRCDHCGDKLWGGAHFRCMTCHINIHSRCVNQVHLACPQHPTRPREDLNGVAQQPPSIFGRDLAEQVKFDLRWGERKVPVVVEKCIEAVETLALDFEGIYRKTGGLSQTKTITQLFDRGDYTAFDLKDTDRFNDICSVTSVLKTYFRSLPVPLLTYDLHEEFITVAGLKDSPLKTKQLQELVARLPPEHYYTLRHLVLHLHRVREHSDANLMTARNLGVVFGPTLMWSRDPGSEFSDMAGKALMIEWLVENAPAIYQP